MTPTTVVEIHYRTKCTCGWAGEPYLDPARAIVSAGDHIGTHEERVSFQPTMWSLDPGEPGPTAA